MISHRNFKKMRLVRELVEGIVTVKHNIFNQQDFEYRLSKKNIQDPAEKSLINISEQINPDRLSEFSHIFNSGPLNNPKI